MDFCVREPGSAPEQSPTAACAGLSRGNDVGMEKAQGEGGGKGGAELLGERGGFLKPRQSVVTSALWYRALSCRRRVWAARPALAGAVGGLSLKPQGLTRSVCSPAPVVLLGPAAGCCVRSPLRAVWRISLPLPWRTLRRCWCEPGCQTQRVTSSGKWGSRLLPLHPWRQAWWPEPGLLPPHEGALTVGPVVGSPAAE